MSIWLARLSVKGASEFISRFSPTFSGAPVNPTVLTLLLQKHCWKKMFQSRCFRRHYQILALFLLKNLPFLAADGITDFGISLAKH